jgi:hypothetical protein
MTQKDKDLLLKDLSARLPYGVKGVVTFHKNMTETREEVRIIDGKLYDRFAKFQDSWYDNVTIKPYLFPLSSMTDELWDKEFMGCGITEFTRDSFKYGCETLEFSNSNTYLSSMVKFINQLIKNHFDIYGLIPMGMAIDATDKNIY